MAPDAPTETARKSVKETWCSFSQYCEIVALSLTTPVPRILGQIFQAKEEKTAYNVMILCGGKTQYMNLFFSWLNSTIIIKIKTDKKWERKKNKNCNNESGLKRKPEREREIEWKKRREKNYTNEIKTKLKTMTSSLATLTHSARLSSMHSVVRHVSSI